MTPKKKGNNKKKNGSEKKKDTAVIGIESRENFALRISEYKKRNHGVIISPKPSIVAMKVASLAGRKMKKATIGTTPATSNSNNKYTEFLRYCGKRVGDILEYDIKTNMVDVHLLLDKEHNDVDSTMKSNFLVIKVPSLALIEELSSFPNQETTKETLNRLLQYEFTSQSVSMPKQISAWRSGGPSCKVYQDSRDANTNTVNDVMSMKVGTMKTELKNYRICTDTFIEKSEFTAALQKARNDTDLKPKTTVRIEIHEENNTTTTFFLDKNKKDSKSTMPVQIVPDYNREKAKNEWHIIKQLKTPPMNLLRRVNELVDVVPIGRERDTYKEFVICATNMHANILDGVMGLAVGGFLGFESDISGQEEKSVGHRVRLELRGEKYIGEYVEFCLTCDAITCKYGGLLNNNGIYEKYHNELQYFILYQLMNCLHKRDDSTSKIIAINLYIMLVGFFEIKKRYSALISITIPAVQRAVFVDCRSVEVVAKMCNNLGEYLEVKGQFKSAALIYAEAGEQLYKVGHHSAATLLMNSGLAWKRNAVNNNGNVNVDDIYKAERYNTMALHSVRFLYDPKRYRTVVFRLLTNIYRLYRNFCDILPKQCCIVLQELLHEANSDFPIHDERIKRAGVLSELRLDLHNVGKDRIICVIQSIIEASVCPQDLRKAIIACGDPETTRFLVMHISSDEPCYHNDWKSAARNHIKDQHPGVQYQCSACCVFVDKNKLLECKCKQVVYCNKSCQKTHWPTHKTKCNWIRRQGQGVK